MTQMLSILYFMTTIVMNHGVEVIKSQKGTAILKFVDIMDNQPYQEEFNAKNHQKKVIWMGDTERYFFDPQSGLFYDDVDDFSDPNMVDMGQTPQQLAETLNRAMQIELFKFIKIGDHFIKHSEHFMQQKQKQENKKLFAKSTFSPFKGKNGNQLFKLSFTTLIQTPPQNVVHPWDKNGEFEVVSFPFKGIVNGKYLEEYIQLSDGFSQLYFSYDPTRQNWFGPAGAYDTKGIQHAIQNTLYTAGVLEILYKPQKVVNYCPIIQTQGGKTKLPVESNTNLVLDNDYVAITPVGLRNINMVNKYWHPRLSEKPHGDDDTYTDDVYWNKVRIDQLQDCTFDILSEYCWIIVQSEPKYVRFLQETKEYRQTKDRIIHYGEQQGWKFGHGAMLTKAEYAQNNEFDFTTEIKHGEKIYIYTTPKYKLIKMAGSFKTDKMGKIKEISNDSGHFPVQKNGDSFNLATKQMKLSNDIQVKPLTAHAAYLNMLRDFEYYDKERLENDLVNRIKAKEMKLNRIKAKQRRNIDYHIMSEIEW
eukprot:314837_1